jgi:hypothetical protein
MVTWCVDEQQTWGFEILPAEHRSAGLVQNIGGNFGGTDVLGDATGFTVHDAGLALTPDGANHVQKTRFSVVNVPQDRHDRLTVMASKRHFAFFGWGDLFVSHGITTPGALL